MLRIIRKETSMKRKHVPKRKGQKQFQHAAAANIAKNISAKPRRGGIRM